MNSASGFISNTHLGNETEKEDIVRGYGILKQVSDKLSIPIRAIGVDDSLRSEFDTIYDGVEVWFYNRMMPRAFW